MGTLKESYPPILHCAHLLLLLSGVSLQAIPYLGMNIHRGRDRKILSSIVEVMEVSNVVVVCFTKMFLKRNTLSIENERVFKEFNL